MEKKNDVFVFDYLTKVFRLKYINSRFPAKEKLNLSLFCAKNFVFHKIFYFYFIFCFLKTLCSIARRRKITNSNRKWNRIFLLIVFLNFIWIKNYWGFMIVFRILIYIFSQRYIVFFLLSFVLFCFVVEYSDSHSHSFNVLMLYSKLYTYKESNFYFENFVNSKLYLLLQFLCT